ncbi:hypothetical protein, partial [uncultured Porphyromonas sp.]|uniref:hypothetical protein n=1 Tax=uncultured Porphyromonas sp. TaxID=159274 RepID=UPI00261A96D7
SNIGAKRPEIHFCRETWATLELKNSSAGTKEFPPLELKNSKGETVFGTRIYNMIKMIQTFQATHTSSE